MMRDLVKVEGRGIVNQDRLRSLAESFISSLDVKERSREAYRKALKGFLAWIEEKGYTTPTRAEILQYRQELEARGLSPLTISAYMVAVRRFFAYLESERIYPNVAKGIKGKKRPRGFLKEALTPGQAKRLLEGIPENGIISSRDYAMLNLMLRTGLRTIEVARARIGDIGAESGETVLRVWGKGRDSKDEFVILTQESYNPILDYLKARKAVKDSDPLFPSHSNRGGEELTTRSIRRIIGQRLRAVGLKTDKITAHSFRHTTATLALSNGADPISVKDMLRHSDLNTTMIYLHNSKRVSEGAEKFVRF